MRRITFGIILILFLIGISTLVRANNGGNIDVYTERGGKGPNVSSGPFMLGEQVILYANVTYASDTYGSSPEVGKWVTFAVDYPNGATGTFYGVTDGDGIASCNLLIPVDTDYLGTWTVTATVDVAGDSCIDTMTFEVNPIQQVVPEVPLGTIISSAAMIIALVAYVAVPKWTRKRE